MGPCEASQGVSSRAEIASGLMVGQQPSHAGEIADGSFVASVRSTTRENFFDSKSGREFRGLPVRCASRLQDRAIAPAVYTFADLATLYETFAKGKKKTRKDDVAKIRRHLLPAWGVNDSRGGSPGCDGRIGSGDRQLVYPAASLVTNGCA
jgi:hypothetical protein